MTAKHMVVVTGWKNQGSVLNGNVDGYFEIYDSNATIIGNPTHPNQLRYTKSGANAGVFSYSALGDQFRRETRNWIEDSSMADVYAWAEDILTSDYPDWNRAVECSGGGVTLSGWGTATVDGGMTAGEWSGAASVLTRK